MPIIKDMNISHKVEIKPNNKTIGYFKKAFGCARLSYNWGLAKWQINRVGQVLPELTPVDLTALLDDLTLNRIATSKVEAGIQL